MSFRRDGGEAEVVTTDGEEGDVAATDDAEEEEYPPNLSVRS